MRRNVRAFKQLSNHEIRTEEYFKILVTTSKTNKLSP